MEDEDEAHPFSGLMPACAPALNQLAWDEVLSACPAPAGTADYSAAMSGLPVRE